MPETTDPVQQIVEAWLNKIPDLDPHDDEAWVVDRLMPLAKELVAHERERCGNLHDSIDPACDHEQDRGGGAGAMGAVIAYRDLIRQGP